jgi:hypothetical protein
MCFTLLPTFPAAEQAFRPLRPEVRGSHGVIAAGREMFRLAFAADPRCERALIAW